MLNTLLLYAAIAAGLAGWYALFLLVYVPRMNRWHAQRRIRDAVRYDEWLKWQNFPKPCD
jgi:hypothetical protein